MDKYFFMIIVLALFLTTIVNVEAKSMDRMDGNSACSYGYSGINCSDECGFTFATQNALIVGGIKAVPHSWPSLAYVLFKYKKDIVIGSLKYTYSFTAACGGTLIDRRTVMTAGHCIQTSVNYKHGTQYYPTSVTNNTYYPTVASMFYVYLGLQDKSIINNDDISPAIKVAVSQVIRHEDFDENKITNDIALLILAEEVELNEYVQIACLPSSNTDDYPPSYITKAYAAGWGTTSYGGVTPNELNNINLTIYSNSVCGKLLASQMCVGDSGGPLFIKSNVNGQNKYTVVGIVSYGYGCASPNYPGIYTRVSSFLDWINSNHNLSKTQNSYQQQSGINQSVLLRGNMNILVFIILLCIIFIFEM